MAQEMPVIDLHSGPIPAERLQVDVLSHRFRWIVRCVGHPGGEVLDPADVMAALKDRFEQQYQIKPLPRRSLQCPVVQVEPVDVDSRPHEHPSEKARASEEAPRPAIETAGGIAPKIGWTNTNVNRPRTGVFFIQHNVHWTSGDKIGRQGSSHDHPTPRMVSRRLGLWPAMPSVAAARAAGLLGPTQDHSKLRPIAIETASHPSGFQAHRRSHGLVFW